MVKRKYKKKGFHSFFDANKLFNELKIKGKNPSLTSYGKAHQKWYNHYVEWEK